jgi:adenylate kinase
MKIIIVTGPPYSGKGTQCESISKAMRFVHLSTGERCRQEKSNKTEIGLIMSNFEEKGDLVPDGIMKNLFNQIIDENKNEKGILLDGYPRTKAQVDDLIELLNSKNEEISMVINIDVPRDELLVRANKRAEDSIREDDKDPRTHLKRVQIFETLTRPAIEYMKTLLPVVVVDGMGEIDDITWRIRQKINF